MFAPYPPCSMLSHHHDLCNPNHQHQVDVIKWKLVQLWLSPPRLKINWCGVELELEKKNTVKKELTHNAPNLNDNNHLLDNIVRPHLRVALPVSKLSSSSISFSSDFYHHHPLHQFHDHTDRLFIDLLEKRMQEGSRTRTRKSKRPPQTRKSTKIPFVVIILLM